jgi:HSP20 family protein
MATERIPRERRELTRSEPMTLANPFSAMRRLSDEMERVVENLWGARRRPTIWRSELAGQWTPDIEMFERGGQLVVRADLPGLTKDAVKVEVIDSELIIEGERREERERQERGYYTCERSYGAFSRTIPLPEGVKGDQAKALFKDGMLEITMPAPKLAEQHGHRLEITAA